ncbi:MAG: putative acyl-CoA dehydrogenase [Rhodospirillales bacterium]|nr:putative acyl-CoA dehydrogenase [Rhodospirillales bacterium]
MAEFTAPLAEIRFALEELALLPEIAALPGYEQASDDLVGAVLEEAGKLAGEVLAPLNATGDREGAILENGAVRTPAGFPVAYRRYVEGGWSALPFAPEHGGQGLPIALSTAVMEMWIAANMAFMLGPILTLGAVDMLEAHGSTEQQHLYLEKLISGEWTATMELTEPQAGSDVGALRTRAIRDGDHYRITGQKIFITYGDHDWADNIVHCVLARTPGSPPGTKGISLFIVPKFLPDENGAPGQRNDLRPVSLEHKLGIHASPTCVMAYGDGGGAIGYLIGEENRGIEYMFTMMNNARLHVGLQGVAIAERAYQQALAYARTRIQGRPVGTKSATPLPIIHHPDVRRMLLAMKAQTEAMRGVAYVTAGGIDRARRHPDPATRQAAQLRVDLLIPVVKAWSTDLGVDVASLGVQVHGGMGYIEETGAAQHLRDARIAPIYEGTNGIQANDLLGRKLMRDKGAAAQALIAEMRGVATLLAAARGDDLAAIRTHLTQAVDALEEATRWIVENWDADPARTLAGATPYLKLLGTVAGGWVMALAALAAQRRLGAREGNPAFSTAKLVTARFYAEQYLPAATALLPAIRGGATVMSFALDQF